MHKCASTQGRARHGGPFAYTHAKNVKRALARTHWNTDWRPVSFEEMKSKKKKNHTHRHTLTHRRTHVLAQTRYHTPDKTVTIRSVCSGVQRTEGTQKGARPQRKDEDRWGEEKKEEPRIMPTTVPFIPELEQRASKPKSRKRNTEITTVSQLKGNGCFNSRYVDSFFFFFFLFFPIVGFLCFSCLLSLFPGLWWHRAGWVSARDSGGGVAGRGGAGRTGGQEAQLLFLLLQPTVVPGFIFIPKNET